MRIAVIGGGPAGLRAAEVAAQGGASVTLFEAKASVGRKFLVAGRGGLNLTNAEAPERFQTRYSKPTERWPELLADFDPVALRSWAAGLGVETFAASTGRVYPRAMKAAPLLRAWVQRLRQSGVELHMHHRWTELREGTRWTLDFDTGDGPKTYETDAVILALGGGSWPQTGSDGTWPPILERLGVQVAPWQPANCGWECLWPSEFLAVAEAKPLKNIEVRAGETIARGELLITQYGLEGGALYQLAPALRRLPEPAIAIDLKPANTVEQLIAKLGPTRRNYLSEAAARWKLSETAAALLAHCAAGTNLESAAQIAELAKNCVIRLSGPRPLAEAISSAGGVAWSELDAGLMVRGCPGVFVAGEMIDWEAPTGGYLMQGCFATGTRAARAALAWGAK